jgi:hypothetical protein
MGLAPAAASNRLVLRLVGTQIYQAVADVLLAVLSPGGVEGPRPAAPGNRRLIVSEA